LNSKIVPRHDPSLMGELTSGFQVAEMKVFYKRLLEHSCVYKSFFVEKSKTLPSLLTLHNFEDLVHRSSVGQLAL
jgi:hypothetical protein